MKQSMKRTGLAAVGVVGVLIVVGCTQQAPAQHTVEDFRTNKSLRREALAKCANDPGTLGSLPDCINAREAERLESVGSLRDSGPIGLDDKKKH